MAILKDFQFNENCRLLKISGLQIRDPDKKAIEKAFRRLALKTHPDKGGDPIEFKKINEAYNKLIGHVAKLEAIEAEAEQSRTTVIIEISKQAVPKWKEKLKCTYGMPKTSQVKNLLFNGPYYQYMGKGRFTGPIVLVLYEDPEDKIPKIVCRCDNYMAWITEQKMPLHLHVDREKNIQFDQWRIMSLAEFGFVSLSSSYSSSSSSSNYKSQAEAKKKKEEQERKEKAAKEEAARKAAEEQKRKEDEEAARLAEEERKKEEELSKMHQPWWKKYADKYSNSNFHMSETTPPPEEDAFPQIFSMTSNSYKPGANSEPQPPKRKPEPTEKPKEVPEDVKVEPEIIKDQDPPVQAEKVPEKSNVVLEETVKKPAQGVKEPDQVVKEPVEAVKVPVQPVIEPIQADKKPVQDNKEPEPVVQPEPVAKDPIVQDETQKQPEIIVQEPLEQVKETEVNSVKIEPMEEDPVLDKASKTEEAKVVNEAPIEGTPTKKATALGNLAEKMISKSKVKKLKSKKASIKKAGKVVGPESDEKENDIEAKKAEDIKMSSARKRPLEENDVEDKLSQGLQGKRSNDTSKDHVAASQKVNSSPARTVTDVEMAHSTSTHNMELVLYQPPTAPPLVVSCPSPPCSMKTESVPTNSESEHGGCPTETESEDLTSPDLLKTLQTVKALKKTLLSTFAKEPLKDDLNLLGKAPEPESAPIEETKKPKEDQNLAKEDQESETGGGDMSMNSDIAFKGEEVDEHKLEKQKAEAEAEVISELQSNSGQVSACQETNNYSLSSPISSLGQQEEASASGDSCSKNASVDDSGKLDTTQNDLECLQELKDEEKNIRQTNLDEQHPSNTCFIKDDINNNSYILHSDDNNDTSKILEQPVVKDEELNKPSPDLQNPAEKDPLVEKAMSPPKVFVKKSTSVEKAEQWLMDRLESKAKSRKNSEMSEPPPLQDLQPASKESSSATASAMPPPLSIPINNIDPATMQPPPATIKASQQQQQNASRFRNMYSRSVQQQPPPADYQSTARRGSTYDYSRGSSLTTSRATSPSMSSRNPSPYSTKTANIVPTPNGNLYRSKSELGNDKPSSSYYNDRIHSSVSRSENTAFSRQPDQEVKLPSVSNSRRASKEDIKLPMSSRRPSREEPTTAKAYSSTSRRPSTVDVDNSNRPRTIKEFSPVILVRPSTFIQAMSAVSPAPPISNNQASKNQDRIPSRFRRAMNVSNATSSSASMTRSKSIHELNDASLGSRAANLQDKIRQAKSDHQKVFDDARSHTHYTRKFSSNGTEGPSRDSRASSHQPEWVAKAHSMRSLRASPIGDYRRLHL